MELILNDFSLDGQFKSDFYNAAVTAELSLNDLMMMANEPAISLLKRYIVNLGYCDPYWDDDMATKEEVQGGL